MKLGDTTTLLGDPKPVISDTSGASRLREETQLLPLDAAQVGSVHLSVALSRKAGGTWFPQRLATFASGQIFLGALTDYEGNVREWLELWVQSAQGLEQSWRSVKNRFNNAVLDTQWCDMVDAMRALEPAACLATGFEKKPPQPVWLKPNITAGDVELCTDDAALARAGLLPYSTSQARYLWVKNHPEKGFLVASENAAVGTPPSEADDVELCKDDAALTRAKLSPYSTSQARYLWVKDHPEKGFLLISENAAAGTPPEVADVELCTDDVVLTRAGLPPYSTSLARYLWVKDHPEKGFLIVSENATVAAGTVPEWHKAVTGLVPFNIGCGLMLVRHRAAIRLEDYIAFLSGNNIHNRPDASVACDGETQSVFIGNWDFTSQIDAAMISSSRREAGRFLETFCHKLRLFKKIVNVAHSLIISRKRPLLNIDTESFRVDFAQPAEDLPVLWSARVVAVKPPDAVELPIKYGGQRYFQKVSPWVSSPFLPSDPHFPVSVSAHIRIQKIVEDADAGTAVVEYAVIGLNKAQALPTDILWMEIPLDGLPPLEIFGRLRTGSPPPPDGELFFVSMPLDLSPRQLAALQRHVGTTLANTQVETIPFINIANDFYALGVLGIRLFLSPSPDDLDETLASVLKFAAEMKATGQTAFELARKSQQWREELGPHRHGHGSTLDKSEEWLPAELWWGVVGVLPRFLPGALADSFLGSLEEIPSEGMRVLNSPRNVLNRLVQNAQDIIFSEWVSSREISRVIRAAR
jgi:hypothetical protein